MLEEQFHFQLLKCFHQQKRWINQRTTQIGVLPGQSKVFQILYEYGPLSPKEIGNICNIDKSTTTSLLNKMEKMEYIKKENQNHDKRSIQILLTQLGQEKAKLVNEICEESDKVILQKIPKDKRKEIIQLLQQINQEESGDQIGNTK